MVRAALYLDFDNVFSGLVKLDPDAAIQFAEDPGSWLSRLTTELTVEGPRRWLVLRCYMNPAGSVPHPKPSSADPRLHLARFRPSFTKAGFDVIDCPRLSYTKNAADIRMVLDAAEALGGPTHYDEFVIASGDSDMTPLLVRLRAADRRTTVLSPSEAVEAFTSVADRLIAGQDVPALVQGEGAIDDAEPDVDECSDPAGVGRSMHGVSPTDGFYPAHQRFDAFVRGRYLASDVPLNLSALAGEVRTELDGAIEEAGWFGFAGFRRAVQGLNLADARFSQHFLWDGNRHESPEQAPPTQAVPAPVARVSAQLNLPRLPKKSWPAVYSTLSSYAASHEFNMTEATRWSRDRLVEAGVEVNRRAVGRVAQGAAFGGCPLYREPPPSATEVRDAFVDNVVARTEALEIPMSSADIAAVRAWLGQSAPLSSG